MSKNRNKRRFWIYGSVVGTFWGIGFFVGINNISPSLAQEQSDVRLLAVPEPPDSVFVRFQENESNSERNENASNSSPSNRNESDDELSEDEKEKLSNDPAFQEFSQVFQEMVQIPGLSSKPSDENLLVRVPEEKSNETSSNLELLKQKESRLCSLWIDSVLNASKIGYRAKSPLDDREDYFNMNDGPFISSSGLCHMAIVGPGFFQVKNIESGEVFYTKAGDFESTLDGTLQLTKNSERYLLLPETNVVLSASSVVSVDSSGNILSKTDSSDSNTPQNSGKISLFGFQNPERLSSEDGVFFQPNELSGLPRKIDESTASLLPGNLELSNARPKLLESQIKNVRRVFKYLDDSKKDSF